MSNAFNLDLRAGVMALLAATGVGACSADFSRLDSSMLGASDERTGSVRGSQGSSSTLGDSAGDKSWSDSGPRPSRGVAVREAGSTSDRRFTPPPYQPPYSSPSTTERHSAASPPSNGYPTNVNRYAPVTAAAPAEPSRPVSVSRAPSLERSTDAGAARSGSTVTVQKGDTLYALSRRYNVGVGEHKSANGLNSNVLRIGQQLVLPGAGAMTAPRQAAGVNGGGVQRLEPRDVAERAADGDDTYTVKRGDSLYKIARANGMTTADLQQINGITDVRRVRPGTVLKLRGEAGNATVRTRTRVATVKTVTTSTTMNDGDDATAAHPASRPNRIAAAEPAAPRLPYSSSQPRILNGSSGSAPTAYADPVPASDSSQTALNAGKFRWPATGRILSAFGPRPDGSHNDGINILVPMGTPVHAAEAGTVAYAGSELQGYGNLVLVRHDSGWVSAYAHNDQLLVKHGDRVTRGQIIAKAGKTGSVDQPQVHFELREGAKPVDPRALLAKL